MKTALKQAPSHPSSETLEAIAELSPWFQNLHLPDGAQTAPDHFLGDYPTFMWQKFASSLPANLEGWRVLDIGCNAGFYSIELARRGACVTGIDLDPRYLAQARWAARQFGVDDQINFEQLQVYDLVHTKDTFDLVLFMGVFYHLRYPLLGLDIVAQKVRKLLVFQTMLMPGEEVHEDTYDCGIFEREAFCNPGWPKMAFIEHFFSGDPTNWWICNRAGVEAMLRSSGLRIVKRPHEEIYLCQPNPHHQSSAVTWNASEFLSATGQKWQRKDAHLKLNGNGRNSQK